MQFKLNALDAFTPQAVQDDCSRRGGTWIEDGSDAAPGTPGYVSPFLTPDQSNASQWYEDEVAPAIAPVEASVASNWKIWLLAGAAAYVLFGRKD